MDVKILHRGMFRLKCRLVVLGWERVIIIIIIMIIIIISLVIIIDIDLLFSPIGLVRWQEGCILVG